MKSMKIYTLIVPIFILFFPIYCLADDISVGEIIGQLKGEHCKYDFASSVCSKRQTGEMPLSLLSSRDKKRCYCQNIAAKCLAALGKNASKALPALTDYLYKGTSDFYNGENTIYCLSNVITAIGKIQDKSSIPHLIKYLESPRKVTLSSEVNKSHYAGIVPAIEALSVYGEDAAEAIPLIKKQLENSGDRRLVVNETIVIRAISQIGGSKEFADVIKYTSDSADFFKTEEDLVFVNFPQTRLLSFISNLKQLEMMSKQEEPDKESLNQIYSLLEKYNTEKNIWIENNIYNRAEEKQVIGNQEMLLDSMRSAWLILVRILARNKDPRVLHDLPDLLMLDEDIKEVENIALNYQKDLREISSDLMNIVGELKSKNNTIPDEQKQANNARIQMITSILKQISLAHKN